MAYIDDVEEREDDFNIRKGLQFKRFHFFVGNLMVALFLMLKIEFSYTAFFGKNIYTFLILFMILDIFLE